jgi:hypothetical protein
LGVKFHKISRKNRSTDYFKSKMSDTRQTIIDLRNQARDSGKTETKTVTINGRECTIEAKAVSFLFFFKKIEITVKYTPIGHRECDVTKFVYYQGCNIDVKIQDVTEKINKIEEKILLQQQKVSQISETLKGFAGQTVATAGLPSHMSQINKTLADMKSFVQQNDFLPEEINMLRQSLRDLCSKPIIQWTNGLFSINEIDYYDPNCLGIALKAEAIEILLDAKESGQVELEKNVPPPIKDLGSGSFNTVKLAHTGKDGQGPVALKPCDQSKKEANANEFTRASRTQQEFIGRVGGNYGRNKATAKLQDILIDIGRGKGITVPHVVATVSAATVKETPCIAMEALQGGTVGKAANDHKIEYDNKFVRSETWMQLQDILTGQIDRHGDNVILTKDGPVAIDHDLSFPTNPPRNFATTVPTKIAVGKPPDDCAVDGVSPRNYCIPPVIDREMYEVIMAINLTDLKNMYKECRLTRHEIQAAMSRARALQNMAQELMDQNRVIDPNRWVKVSTRKKGPCNGDNFYAARHFHGG